MNGLVVAMGFITFLVTYIFIIDVLIEIKKSLQTLADLHAIAVNNIAEVDISLNGIDSTLSDRNKLIGGK